MAGTSAGAAKATAARIAKAKERRERALLIEAGGTVIEQPSSVVGLTVDGHMPVVATLPAVGPVDQAVTGLLPLAVSVVGKILQGTLRAPAVVRANTALRIMEMAQQPAGKGQPPSGMGAAIEALGKAFALRSRTVDAVDARVVAVSQPAERQS